MADYTSKLNLKNEIMNTDKTSIENENQSSCLGAVSGSAWVAETRICGNCKHFKLDVGANIMGTCSKKLMIVISDMFVNYKKDDGTCFE